MLFAILDIEGGAEGPGGAGTAGVEPPIEAANPASAGMLVVMMSVTLARVGKALPWSDLLRGGRGGASSPELR